MNIHSKQHQNRRPTQPHESGTNKKNNDTQIPFPKKNVHNITGIF